MFDVKKEVPSLELCKKLKEIGFPQDTGGWYWIQNPIDIEKYSLMFLSEREYEFRLNFAFGELIKAPTIMEIIEYFNNLNLQEYSISIKFDIIGMKDCIKIYLLKKELLNHYSALKSFEIYNLKDLTDNLTKMLIWLVEKAYIKLNNKEK